MQIMGAGLTLHPWDGGDFSSRCLVPVSCAGAGGGNLLLGGLTVPSPVARLHPQIWLHPGWGTNTTSCIPTGFTPSPSPQDKADIESLLSPENVNRDALLSYAKEAANFSTNYRLPELEFALNHRDLPDVDMFDFTCMTRSENAALVREHNGSRLLIGLVGDCLVEVRVPLAAPPPASVSPLPARSLGCNIFHLPERFLSPLPSAPHPQVPAGGCFGGVISFPSPTRDLGEGGGQGGGAAQLLPRRIHAGGSVGSAVGLGRRQPPVRSLCVLPPLPAFIPGQARQVPASSQPPRPAAWLQPHLSLPFPSQPFWPLGTGVARGFLAAFDAAWMVRRWAAGTPPLEVLAER